MPAGPIPTFERLPAPAPPPRTRPHFVKEDEVILWVGRPVLRAVASNLGGILIFFVLLLFLTGLRNVVQSGNPTLVLPILLIVVLIFALLPMIALSRMVYVITDSGAYTRTGIFGERVHQTSFEKITDISYAQDIAGRFLSYGSLHINTAGSATNALTMIGLPAALEVKRLLEGARARRLHQRRPAGAGAAALPVFVPKEDVAQVRCAACSMLFKRPRAEMGGTAACPHCGQPTGLKEVAPDG